MIDAGLISRDDLEQCLLMAQETSLPVGRILLLTRKTTEPVLQAAVRMQSMLKDGLIDLDAAHKALQTVKKEEISLDQALAKLNVQIEDTSINKLGDLLISANFVSEDQLEKALTESSSTGLPFGRMLVLQGFITESQLAAALNAQILVRDKHITRDQAIQGLKQARRRQIAVEVPLMEKGFYKVQKRETVRLGELLCLAGFIGDTQLLNAVEVGLINHKPIGQVLVELNLITERTQRTALQIQELVEKGTLKPLDASRILLEVEQTGMSIAEAVALLEREKLRGPNQVTLKDFLMSANSITDDDIRSAFESSVSNNQILGRMLLLSGIIDESTLESAMRLVGLVRNGNLSMENAQSAFNESQRGSANLEDVLRNLGFANESSPEQ